MKYLVELQLKVKVPLDMQNAIDKMEDQIKEAMMATLQNSLQN